MTPVTQKEKMSSQINHNIRLFQHYNTTF